MKGFLKVLWGLALVATSSAFAQSTPEVVYSTEEVVARRWMADEQPTTFTAAKDSRLEILVRDDSGWLRVRSGRDLGWVPADKTTTVVPEGAAAAQAAPSINLGNLAEGLQLPPGFTLGGAE